MTLKNAIAAQCTRHFALVPLLGLAAIAGCSSQRAYEAAFSSTTALTNNSHVYEASADQVFNALKLSLVQQGFEIEQVNATEGLLQGIRTFDDPKDPKIAYLVTVTGDVAASSPGATTLTAAASQKTVLNREVHKYYHLLGLVPIPTGREYQSVVRAEGDITGGSFYQDLFAAVSRNLEGTQAQVVAPLRSAAPAGTPASAAKGKTHLQ